MVSVKKTNKQQLKYSIAFHYRNVFVFLDIKVPIVTVIIINQNL